MLFRSNLVTAKTEGNWRCLCNSRQAGWVAQLSEISVLREQLSQLDETLKNNHRSLVLKGTLNGKTVIAKQPRDKNKRLWARILSYLEPSEAAQTLESLEIFHQRGIASVQPILVLEKLGFGAVVNSWLVYEYREGQSSQEQDLPRVIDFLHKLHKAGFRHNDPNLGNFLIDPKDEMFLLDCKGRKRSGNFSDANDFFLLKKINKTLSDFELSDVHQLDRFSWGYRLALAYNKVKLARSFLKDRIKKNRPKNTDS